LMMLVAAAFGVVILAFLVFPLWAVIDIASTPESAFEEAGQSRTVWLVLILGLTFTGGLPGLVVAIAYLWGKGPKLGGSQTSDEEQSPA
jgi:hypothetical protein